MVTISLPSPQGWLAILGGVDPVCEFSHRSNEDENESKPRKRHRHPLVQQMPFSPGKYSMYSSSNLLANILPNPIDDRATQTPCI